MSTITKWSDESTREFIQLRFKLRHLFNGKKHQCEQAYSRIVKELGLSTDISAAQARKKWSNLKQKYMDIKGGCSTATIDWAYYQLMDQIIPIMHKEKLEKAPSTLSVTVVNSQDGSILRTTTVPSTSKAASEGQSNKTSLPIKREASPDNTNGFNCEVAFVNRQKQKDFSEPPYKKGRTRKAAQQARDNWWGAVEDPLENPAQEKMLSEIAVSYEATQLELRSLQLLESCSNSLNDIRDQLKQQTKQHNIDAKNLQETVAAQGNTIKGLLTTLTQQNKLLLSLLRHTNSNSINMKAVDNCELETEDS